MASSSRCVKALRCLGSLSCRSMKMEDQTRGWSVSLKNGVVLLLGQGGVSSVQESENSTSTMFHCRFETLWYHCLSCLSPDIDPSDTDANLSLRFVSKHAFSHHPLWNSGISQPASAGCPCFVLEEGSEIARHPLRLYKTAFFWQGDCWLESCVVYLVNSVSVMKLLFYLSGNWARYILILG